MSEKAENAEVAGAETASSADRFGTLIERADDADFPYYAGAPVAMSAAQWVLAWAAVAVGFAALVLIPTSDNIGMLVPRILFVAIPLVVLGWVSRHRLALFRRVTGRDVGLMIGFAVLNLLVSIGLAVVVDAFFGSASNPAVEDAGEGGVLDTVAFFVGTGFQLVGEEVFTIIPFLAVLYFATAKAGLSRRHAVLLAWLVSSLWFAAAHLPTYDWNFAQAFLVIGGARIILTLAYIRTKNLAVSAGAHIINDWTLFGQAVAVNSALALF